MESGSQLSPPSLRFGLAGIANTLVGLSVICLAKSEFGVDDVPANLLGYSVGLVCSFVLNRIWTFRHRGPVAPAVGRFLAVQGLAYCLNLATVLALLGAGIDDYLAQAMGVPIYFTFGYIGCRQWAFRDGVPG